MKFDSTTIGLLIFYGVGFLMLITIGITYLVSKKR